MRYIYLISITLIIIFYKNEFYAMDIVKGFYYSLNWTELKYTNEEYYWNLSNMRLYRTGVFLEFVINNKISIKNSLNYLNLGSRNNIKNLIIDIYIFQIKVDILLNYLTYNLDLLYHLKQDCSFYLFSGLEVGYLLNAKEIIDGKYGIYSPNLYKHEEKNINDIFNKYNLGVHIGFGMDVYHYKSLKLFFEPYYNFGLINISKKSITKNLIKPREIGIKAGVKF